MSPTSTRTASQRSTSSRPWMSNWRTPCPACSPRTSTPPSTCPWPTWPPATGTRSAPRTARVRLWTRPSPCPSRRRSARASSTPRPWCRALRSASRRARPFRRAPTPSWTWSSRTTASPRWACAPRPPWARTSAVAPRTWPRGRSSCAPAPVWAPGRWRCWQGWGARGCSYTRVRASWSCPSGTNWWSPAARRAPAPSSTPTGTPCPPRSRTRARRPSVSRLFPTRGRSSARRSRTSWCAPTSCSRRAASPTAAATRCARCSAPWGLCASTTWRRGRATSWGSAPSAARTGERRRRSSACRATRCRPRCASRCSSARPCATCRGGSR